MIGAVLGHVLDRYAAHRRRRMEAVSRDAAAIQDATLRRLVAAGRDTEFGLRHDFSAIRTLADYQARVPVAGYEAFAPLWARALDGEPSITWPGPCPDWVKTSGTTSGDKLIPVTREAFAMHRRGGWDALAIAAERAGGRRLLDGKLLMLGGSRTAHAAGRGCRVGDLSGLAVKRLPPGIRGRYAPGADLAAIEDWSARLDAVARRVVGQDLRLIAGMPSWLLVLFERVARERHAAGRPLRDMAQCWPNLRVLVHGGVAFAPYADVFGEWMGRPLERVEVYPASEGFVGLQTERSGALTLMLDYGIFYEFVPLADLGMAAPRRHTVADVEIGRHYAVVLTTPAGLWSYLLGDTVRFVARDPLRLVITGRTRHFVNAFGENVIVEQVERALTSACRRTEAEVVEFTVAPRYPSAAEPRGAHEWLVEFRVPPTEPEVFARVLDETLAVTNTDYRTKREGDVGMAPPLVTALPPGAFHAWLHRQGKLGDQHKVPRALNDRTVADALLRAAGPSASPAARPPVPAAP